MTRPVGRPVLLCLALPVLLGVDRPPGLGDVTEIRHWSYPEYTRVVVELTRPVETEVRVLGPDRAEGRPKRLYLDLAGIWVGLRYVDPIPVGDGLLEGIRLGQNSRTTTRVVIDLKRYDHHRLFFLSSPSRVVIDVYGGDPDGAVRPDRRARRTPSRHGQLPPGMRRVRTVVLDRVADVLDRVRVEHRVVGQRLGDVDPDSAVQPIMRVRQAVAELVAPLEVADLVVVDQDAGELVVARRRWVVPAAVDRDRPATQGVRVLDVVRRHGRGGAGLSATGGAT